MTSQARSIHYDPQSVTIRNARPDFDADEHSAIRVIQAVEHGEAAFNRTLWQAAGTLAFAALATTVLPLAAALPLALALPFYTVGVAEEPLG